MIVSNATPLIAFARIGELVLLERIVEQLTLPQAVWREVTEVPERPGADTIRRASWIDVQSVREVSADLLALLDLGEAEVIALAEELGADEVIIDERAARAIAITRGLPVIDDVSGQLQDTAASDAVAKQSPRLGGALEVARGASSWGKSVHAARDGGDPDETTWPTYANRTWTNKFLPGWQWTTNRLARKRTPRPPWWPHRARAAACSAQFCGG